MESRGSCYKNNCSYLIVDFSLQEKKYNINCQKLANLLVHTHHYLGSENVFSHI